MFTKKIFKNQLTKDLFIISVSFILLIFISLKDKNGQTDNSLLPQALASVNDNFSGYAWSDNIGWISFNCTDTDTCSTSNYGVKVDSNNKVSGYAWSDNIGWISFNESDLSSCPVDDCKAKLVGGKLTGWARALANGSGWDGWVSLSKKSTDGESISYGVSLREDSHFEGFAWGGEVVGWIDFNPVLGEGVVLLEEFPSINTFQVSTVVTGSKPTAYFETENVETCNLTTNTGYKDLSVCSGSDQCAIVAELLIDKEVMKETTYTLTCFNRIGTSVARVVPVYEYFELTATPLEVLIDFAGGPATTTPTAIGVTPWNGFTSDVTFSADLSGLPESPGGETTNTATFSRQTLSFSDYFTNQLKSILKVFASYRFTGEDYMDVIGNGTERLTITINAGPVEPVYEEI